MQIKKAWNYYFYCIQRIIIVSLSLIKAVRTDNSQNRNLSFYLSDEAALFHAVIVDKLQLQRAFSPR